MKHILDRATSVESVNINVEYYEFYDEIVSEKTSI